MEKPFEYQWGGKMLFSHGTFHSKWVCPTFRYILKYKLLKTIYDTGDRYIVACVEIQRLPSILINGYARNTEKGQIKTFIEVANYLAEMDIRPDSKYICAGD